MTQDSTYATASPAPEARHCCGLGRTELAGPEGNLPPGRWPGSFTPDIAAHSAPAERKETCGLTSWTQSKPANTGRSGSTHGTHLPPTWGAVAAPWATDSDGTCRTAINPAAGPRSAGPGSDFRQDVPGDDPFPGPGATSECPNSRTAGP